MTGKHKWGYLGKAGFPGIPADWGIGEQVEFGKWKGFLLTVLERRPKHKQEG